MKYHQCNESVKKSIFGIASLGKKLGSHTEEVVQIEPKLVLSIPYVGSEEETEIFAKAWLGKKLVFNTEICEFRD